QQKLFARALAIGSDEQGPAVLVAIDNCAAPAALTEAVAVRLKERFGISRERFVLCSTHTHNAPMLTGVLNNLFVKDFTERELAGLERYTADLGEKIYQAVAAALANRRPAVMEWSVGSVAF